MDKKDTHTMLYTLVGRQQAELSRYLSVKTSQIHASTRGNGLLLIKYQLGGFVEVKNLAKMGEIGFKSNCEKQD